MSMKDFNVKDHKKLYKYINNKSRWIWNIEAYVSLITRVLSLMYHETKILMAESPLLPLIFTNLEISRNW